MARTTYDATTQTYTLSAGGANMWFARDEFQFAWRRMSGDFVMRTHVRFLGEGVEPHRKIGIIVRKGLEADSPYVDAVRHGDGLTSLQRRDESGGLTTTTIASISHADVLELKREGRRYVMGVARFGEPMVHTEVFGPDLGEQVYVGLFACSHNAAVKETAVFSNVRIVVPPKAGWVPYRDYIGSNLEVMDVRTGARTVVHTSPISIQAPNWTPDGKTLIFNGSGKLWTFDLATRAVAELPTGRATRNNNDHVLSPDGTMLGISSHSQEPGDNGRSVIYVLPTAGGEPTRVTPNSPSYLHSWSLDKQWLFYTGQRNNELDIYKIAVDGGEEVRLTTTPGVDDGSELTPDGQWLYFNSNRSGHMQIWRMKPDGSEPAADHVRPVQQLVPAHLARRQVDGDHLVRRGHRIGRPPVLQARLPPAHGHRRLEREGDRVRVRRTGDDQRAVVVAGRHPDRVCQQLGAAGAPLKDGGRRREEGGRRREEGCPAPLSLSCRRSR